MELRAELATLGHWTGDRMSAPDVRPAPPAAGGLRLASWRLLLDLGRMQQGEPHLAGTARPTEAVMSAATAASRGLTEGSLVTVSTPDGSLTLPLRLDEVAHDTVWLPMHSPGCSIVQDLGAVPGDVVEVVPGGPR